MAVSTEALVVGFGHLVQSNSGSETCVVKGLFVSPNWARKGVGSALLQLLEDRARVGGYVSVCLKSSLNAEGFYKKMGYSVVDPINKHVCCDQTLKCVMMNKNLQL